MKREKNRKDYKWLSLIVFAVLIAGWCAASYSGVVSKIFLPSPSDVIDEMVKGIKDGSLWQNCWISTKRVMIGWFWSAVVALPLGMLMALSRRFTAIIRPFIEFARYLPVVALVPLTLLYLGIDEEQKYTVIWLGTFFQLILMVCDTVSSVDGNQVNAARTLDANRWQIYIYVILPASLPGLMDDFRLTIGWAWTYLVVAEMVAAGSGLGYIILKSQRFLATDVIFMGLILIGLIGLLTDFLLRLLSGVLVPWYKRLGD